MLHNAGTPFSILSTPCHNKPFGSTRKLPAIYTIYFLVRSSAICRKWNRLLEQMQWSFVAKRFHIGREKRFISHGSMITVLTNENSFGPVFNGHSICSCLNFGNGYWFVFSVYGPLVTTPARASAFITLKKHTLSHYGNLGNYKWNVY